MPALDLGDSSLDHVEALDVDAQDAIKVLERPPERIPSSHVKWKYPDRAGFKQ
jgi:hypothetical protein